MFTVLVHACTRGLSQTLCVGGFEGGRGTEMFSFYKPSLLSHMTSWYDALFIFHTIVYFCADLCMYFTVQSNCIYSLVYFSLTVAVGLTHV